MAVYLAERIWDEGLAELMGSTAFKATPKLKDHIVEKEGTDLKFNSTSFPSWLDYADPKELMKVGYNAAMTELSGDAFDQIYREVLGREPDAAGKAFWKDHYEAGRMTLGEVIVAVESSDEANAKPK